MLYQRLSPGLYSLLVAYTVAIGGMCIGYDVVVMNAAILMPDFIRMADTTKQDTMAFLSSVLIIGAAIGTFPAAWIADNFGRRLPISLGSLLYIVGTGVQLGANKRNMILGGRAISGFGVGFIALCCTLYITEISTSSNRVYTATKDDFGKERQWKMPLGVSMGPGIILMLVIWLMPESPRWLMKKGREAEAIHSLSKFHSRGNIKDTFVCTEAADIKSACLSERDQGGPFLSIFKNKSIKRRFVIGSILAASSQVTGQSIMQYYTPALYRSLNFSLKRTLLFQCAHAGLGLVGTMFAIALMDRLGRRFLSVTSMGLCSLSLAGAMISIKQWPSDSLKSNAETGHYIHLGFTWLFYFAYNAGIAPIVFTYTSEIFNTHNRAWGSALCLGTNWFAQFMITQGAAKGFEKMEWKYYLIFLVMAALNGFLLLLGMPETKGRTLEEMDHYWSFENLPGRVVLGKKRQGRSGSIGRTEREMQMRSGLIVRLQRQDHHEAGGQVPGGVELKGSPIV